MKAEDLANLIYRETGQVVSKNGVIGRLYRLRDEQAHQELAEDLAKLKRRGTTL
jgi:hypothetical protein